MSGFTRLLASVLATGLLAPIAQAGDRAASAARKDSAGGKSPAPVYSEQLLARQIALDRAGFSPGLIDGKSGPRTRSALCAFQRFAGLTASGEFDVATDAALEVASLPPLTGYTISDEDSRQIGPVPRDWNAKAALSRLKFASLEELVAERGHCSRATLARLNPGRDLSRLRAGDRLTIPNVSAPRRLPAAATVEVHLDAKTVTARDAQGRVTAVFHCSVAKDPKKFPKGVTRLASVAIEPDYLFDPKVWPEVHNVSRKLTIPPGPRNPVGLAWLGTGLPGYGIHGTPNPELIGKTGSHGCIRMTNWDVLRLAEIVRVGTPVRFVRSGDLS